MSETETQKIFSTRDIYLASTLVTLKFEMVGIDYQVEGVKPKPIGYFKFVDSQELQAVRSKYNQSMISLEPKLFISNLQSLKAEVVNMFQNPNSEMNRGRA